MENDFEKLVIEALENEDEIRLHLGDNEFYIQNLDFSITIEYSLDSDTEFYSYFDDCSFAERYMFNVNSIVVNDLNSDTEYSVTPNKEIRSAIINNAFLDNWSGSLICLANASFEY